MTLFRSLFYGAVLTIAVLTNLDIFQLQQGSILLTTTASYTPPVTVTGWPTRTVTPTRTATLPGTATATPTPTSHPGEPTLITPPDGALLSQPLAPNEWYFKWSGRTGPCWGYIDLSGPNGQHIVQDSTYIIGNTYYSHYTTTVPIADTDLGPWTWFAGINCPLGVSQSETRTFWVESASGLPTGTPTPTPGPTNTPTATPTKTGTPCPQPTPEPLWVVPVTSPTSLLYQPITIRIGNGEAVTITAESGVFTTTGTFNAYASPAVITMTLLSNTTHHLSVQAHVRSVNQGGCVYGNYTLSTTVDQLGAPLIIEQINGFKAYLPLALAGAAGGISPTPTTTPCSDGC